MELHQIPQLLDETLSPDGNAVRTATDSLDRLSLHPDFPFYLLSITTGGQSPGQRVAAATYLKNFTRRNVDGAVQSSKISKEVKNQLLRALLQVEPAVLKVLVEVFRIIVSSLFVKENSWPELVPELASAIQNSNLISDAAHCEWNTINALTVLQALISPFQYFLNPKVPKEPVPPQLELITKKILVPLLAVFHQLVDKALTFHGKPEAETEKTLLIACKCIYLAVRSHMPSTLAPFLPSFCHDLFKILGSLSFDHMDPLEEGYLLRLKTGKRSLLIFCALVTRHRKFSDRLMPDIINCVLKIVMHSKKTSKLGFPSERVISLAFDVISHILETGPGWRLVSPNFSSLLESAIFPALVMNEKDISEWEEDADEYIRKNHPSDLGESSGWREDLFTVRKSAMNLLGVISVSKGPPVVASNCSSALSKRKKGEKSRGKDQRCFMGELLVIPFLSKFPIPSDANVSEMKIINDYYGVLMAYGGLQDFLKEQKPGYVSTLVRNRVLPVYKTSVSLPYLVATANWVLGELAFSLPEEMSTDVYSSLLMALAMPDMGDISCFPVRASAAGAISELLDNEYLPPEWLPLLQVVVGRIGDEDEENSVLFQLLSTVVEAGNENVAVHMPYIISSLVGQISESIPPKPEPWPQMVEGGFAALAVMSQSWEESMPEETEQNESAVWLSGQATIAKAFSSLLQQAWITSIQPMEGSIFNLEVPSSCIDDSSTLLRSVMRSITTYNELLELKVSELLVVWSDLIANWHAWEEMEDLSIFECIKEVVNLHGKFGLKDFIMRGLPSPPAPPVPQRSIIEGISVFVSAAIAEYPSATWRASSCVHVLLHVPTYSTEVECVKQSLVIAFTEAAFLRFKAIRHKPCSMWKPLLLTISSCYLCYPDIVERVLVKNELAGFTIWASALGFVATSTFEHGPSADSEIKLTIMALAKVIEHLIGQGNQDSDLLLGCFTSLMEASMRLKELQEEDDNEGAEDDEDAGDEDTDDEDDDDDDDDDEDSEDGEFEETEEQFLERYAKAAVALENGTLVEEGDEEDLEQEVDLGGLEEIDQKGIVLSLIQRYHQVLIRGKSFPRPIVSGFVNSFPEYGLFFQHRG